METNPNPIIEDTTVHPINPTQEEILHSLLGNREDPGLIPICHTNKRPTVLALSATTCAQVTVSPETAMGCRRIRFLQAERGLLYLSLY